MKRSIEAYENCSPEAMAKMSEAAIMYAFRDMRDDILSLHGSLSDMVELRDLTMRAQVNPEKPEVNVVAIARKLAEGKA